jgi:hypothetical protein
MARPDGAGAEMAKHNGQITIPGYRGFMDVRGKTDHMNLTKFIAAEKHFRTQQHSRQKMVQNAPLCLQCGKLVL